MNQHGKNWFYQKMVYIYVKNVKRRLKWIEICCPIIYIVGINALFDILESINMLDMALLSCVLLVIGLTAYFIYLQKLRIYVLEDESV